MKKKEARKHHSLFDIDNMDLASSFCVKFFSLRSSFKFPLKSIILPPHYMSIQNFCIFILTTQNFCANLYVSSTEILYFKRRKTQ